MRDGQRLAWGDAMSRLPYVSGWILAVTALSLLAEPTAVHARSCPNLAIVVDRSSSMLNTLAGTSPMAGEQSRWQVVGGAISALLTRYDGKLPVGISFFPRPGSTCSTSSFAVSPAYGSRGAIESALGDVGALPVANALTPTCGAIDALAADATLRDASRSQYIILITDGRPLCQSSAGCTCDACSSLGAQNAAVASVRQARSQAPSIHTFVVGLGATLDAGDKQSLNDIAGEGGEANGDPSSDYYPAETAAMLSMQLDRVMAVILGLSESGGSLTCDDSCYSQGCAAGKICVQSACSNNPCDGLSCPTGQYCYTNGASATCIAACPQTCATGSRCVRGSCAEDPCGTPCRSGQRCDPGTGQCQTDPACSNVTCKLSQACQAGRCVDDPCGYMQCPPGLSCVPFEGTCLATDGAQSGGCSCDLHGEPQPSRALAAWIPLGVLVALHLARRRRSNDRGRAKRPAVWA